MTLKFRFLEKHLDILFQQLFLQHYIDFLLGKCLNYICITYVSIKSVSWSGVVLLISPAKHRTDFSAGSKHAALSARLAWLNSAVSCMVGWNMLSESYVLLHLTSSSDSLTLHIPFQKLSQSESSSDLLTCNYSPVSSEQHSAVKSKK